VSGSTATPATLSFVSGAIDLPEPGTTLGRYVLDERVATGGMGVVYRGRIRGAHGFERKVALKTIHPSLIESEAHRARFLDEARIISTIHHDNIVQVLDVVDEGGLLFLVLEWIDGPSVRRLLNHAEATKTRVPLPVVVRIVLDVLDGLQYAHELTDEAGKPRMLVHRDVSPENIIVNELGKSKLIDFGIAKAQGRLGTDTATGQVFGKAAFMAPEQARSLPVDRRADIWAVGAVLRLLATGTLAYDAPSQMQRMYMLALGQDPDPLPEDAPAWLAGILARAMAVDPNERFATCADFAAALHEARVEIESHAGVAAYVRAFGRPSMPPPDSQVAPTEVVARTSIPPSDELDTTAEELLTTTESTLPGANAAPTLPGAIEPTLPSATLEPDGVTTEITSVLPAPARTSEVPRRVGARPQDGSSRAKRIGLGVFGVAVVALVLLLAHAAVSDDAPTAGNAGGASERASSAPASAFLPVTEPAPTAEPATASASSEETLELDPDPVASSEPVRTTTPRPPTSRPPTDRRSIPRAAPSFNDYGF